MNFNKKRVVIDDYGNLVNVTNIVPINELFGLRCYYVATDEYNMLYFKCWQSGRFICESDLMIVGGNIPNSNCKFPIHKESILIYKDSCKLFEISEANCNTCKFLQRIKHEKSTDGFLKGKCTKKGIDLKFHPNDPMWYINNDCYIHRKD